MNLDKEIIQDGDVSKNNDELIFNPYNPNNVEITEADASLILKKYGVPDSFHNFKLYISDKTHQFIRLIN